MNQLILNLKDVSIAMAIFALAWTTNFVPSLYYNTKLLEEIFDKNKLKNGILKMLTIVISVGLLAILATVLPIYLQHIGMSISEDSLKLFNITAIILAFITPTYMYAKQAILTITDIVQFKNKK